MLKIIIFICTLIALHLAPTSKQMKQKGNDVTRNKVSLFSAAFFTKS